MEQAISEGHICLPRETLIEAARELLEIELRPVENALELLLVSGDLVAEEDFVYLAGLRRAEYGVASKLTELKGARLDLPSIDLEKALAWVQQQTGIALATAQQQAIKTALTAKVCVITGGPGVGKTTIVNSIVRILKAKKCQVLLAAPTGRAAKRMSEATGVAAQTIHRLLKNDPQTGGFTYNESRPLKGDVIIIDETSMLDIPLAYHLLKAIPLSASVVLVGDVDQLPSVGPGNFLHDLIESGAVPVVRLTEIFRQAKESFIITNAHRVNQGELPVLDAPAESDFFFIEEDVPGTRRHHHPGTVSGTDPAQIWFGPDARHSGAHAHAQRHLRRGKFKQRVASRAQPHRAEPAALRTHLPGRRPRDANSQ